MELVNTNDENSFDPTPRLKSSPIPIKFLSFNNEDNKCFNCGEEYIGAYLYKVVERVVESENYCKLCGKPFEHPFKEYDYLRLCPNCYLISSEWIESTLVKKRTLILYLPCSEHSDIDDFLFNDVLHDNFELADTVNIVKNIDKYYYPWKILNSIFVKQNSKDKPINWTPYSQFKDVKEMTKGGYGVIHKATWLSNNETIILKRFENSKNSSNYFLNELKSYRHCIDKSLYSHIIKIYGFTRDPESEDYILVMKYASKGDLHKYLQKSFKNITWNNQKLRILWQISEGLEHIHKNQFIHRDFHSGNILFDLFNDQNDQKKTKVRYQWKIADLGLSHPVNNKSSNNEIYGVIPYIAPEIFKGAAFSKKADIYSLDIRLTFGSWAFRGKNKAEFDQAESKRKKLIELKKIGPEFAEKYHSEAIYTSRLLSDLISKCSSTNSSSTISYDNKQDCNYISLNAVTKSFSAQNLSSIIQTCSASFDYISTELELDIDTERLSSQNLSIKTQISPTTLKKRNIEELNPETDDDNVGKRIKS
ncbi:kinase-like domain-containing protein [Rhizophagus irregularis DAOM 181602=DAOM 197198]|nr:kinase-like domain-containing protein [Rhizophagus irregularis DAOM 181602=DAOM 197198]